MKTKLLFILLVIFCSTIAISQVTGGQVDDFEDGTTQSWSEGGPSTNPPINISTGGPTGVNDNFLQNDSSGGTGAGSKMVMFNPSIKWGGNYTSAGITSITCDVRVSTNTLNLRIAMTGPGGRIASANSVDVAPSLNWTKITFPVTASDMALAGGTNGASTLSNVTELRILSSTSPSWQGASINARLEIDNITAETTLSTKEFFIDGFIISPNPGNTFIKLKVPQLVQIDEIKIFDILGKKVYYNNKLEDQIDITHWSNGIYLVKVSSNGNTKTKRFIKL